MSGHLVRRGDNTWLVRIPLGRDATGKRRFHNKTVKGNKKDAQRYLVKTQREMDTSTFVEASQRLLADHLRDWLNGSAAQRVRTRTLIDYKSLADRYLIPSMGHLKLSQLTAHDIQRTYGSMQQKGLSPRTIRYAHSVLHGALNQAVKWRLLAQNPAKLVDLPTQKRRAMRALSAAEAAQFLASAAGNRFEALWILLLTTGLRPGEALALRWRDVTPDGATIQRSLTRTPSGLEFTDPCQRRLKMGHHHRVKMGHGEGG